MDFVVVDDYQQNVPCTEIDGKPNIIDMLYTQEGIDQYPGHPHSDFKKYDIVREQSNKIYNPTDTIRVLAPTGVRSGFDAAPGEIILISSLMRTTPRAYLSKFPFQIFSGFSAIKNFSTLLTSLDDYMLYVNTFYLHDKGAEIW